MPRKSTWQTVAPMLFGDGTAGMLTRLSAIELFVLLVAIVLTVGVIRLMMIAAPRWGLVDHPGHRKVHQHPTPLVGGLGMFFVMVLVQVAMGTMPFESWSLFFALLVITVIGVADDAHELSHRAKFVAQIIGSLIVVSGTSVWVTSFGDLLGIGSLEFGKWGMLVTVVAMVGVMNAINMIDGLDGLAGSVSLMSLIVFACVALGSENARLAFELLLVSCVLIGFLLLNLRLHGRERAQVFMGDTGGLILGLLLAWYSIKLGGSAASAVKPITAVWILAVPLLDMGSVMLLRLSQRKNPFHGDQQHMHHVLLHAGYSVNQVVGIMAALAFGLALVAVVCELQGVPQPVMFFGFLCLWGGYYAALKFPDACRQAFVRLIRPTGDKVGSPAS